MSKHNNCAQGYNPTYAQSCDFYMKPSEAGSVTVDGSNFVQFFVDRSPNAQTYSQGTGSKQPLYTDGKSFSFDGGDALPVDGLFTNYASNDLVGSVCMWVKPTDATPAAGQSFFTVGGTSSNTFMQMFILTSGLFFCSLRRIGIDNWALQTNVSPFADNTWCHVAIVQDATEPKLYINGVFVAQTFTVSTTKTRWLSYIAGAAINVRVGARNINSLGDGSYFNGSIGDSYYCNRALTATEVAIHYDSQKALYV